jgi:hypothetical protein
LRSYTEGLRERIISYFEVHNLNLKKPKLVGVTGCADGAGVSTLASGLAAALSKTGDGNVLLVDMNVDQGWSFLLKGQTWLRHFRCPRTGESRRAQFRTIFTSPPSTAGDDKLMKVAYPLQPPEQAQGERLRLHHFDGPVTQTSASRLASYMV